MSAIVNKATGLITRLTEKSVQATNAAVYWGKVGAEVGKIVYKQEGLAPPTSKQFLEVYQKALKFIKSPKDQQALLEKASQFKVTKEVGVKAAVYGTQLLAFFSIGEIIGRRKVFGYPSFGHAEHH